LLATQLVEKPVSEKQQTWTPPSVQSAALVHPRVTIIMGKPPPSSEEAPPDEELPEAVPSIPESSPGVAASGLPLLDDDEQAAAKATAHETKAKTVELRIGKYPPAPEVTAP
jgi:hypothetical protein